MDNLDKNWFMQAWADAFAHGASDLHLVSGSPPRMRCKGQFRLLSEQPCCPKLPWQSIAGLLALSQDDPLLNPESTRSTHKPTAIQHTQEGVLVHAKLGRGRWCLARQEQGLMLSIRLLPHTMPDLNFVDLNLQLANLVEHKGLLLVTGATGSGKSSTLAALVQHWRSQHIGHVLTLEDPIELIYPETEGLVTQRQIGRDCASFSDGLRSSLRQDPDVILIGEIRDYDSARLALTCAETGHLVLATLHTRTAVGAINRLLSFFPANEQALAQSLLADTLIAILSQALYWPPQTTLINALSSSERQIQVCREVLIAIPAVRHLIRQQQLNQINNIMQTHSSIGMLTREQALAHLQRTRACFIGQATCKEAIWSP